MTRLKWISGERLSPIHAARCFSIGAHGVDEAISRGIAGPVANLNGRLAGADVDLSVFWSNLMAAVAAGESDADAAREALIAAGCSSLSCDTTAAGVTSELADVRSVYQQRYPKLSEQLQLRGRPIREQWDGYGLGLLKRIGKLTHPSFLPKNVTALLLSPYRAGDGGIDSSASRLWIEAVLTNPVHDLPEILRLVWLVAQIGLIEALSVGPEDSHGDPWVPPARLPRIASLSMMALTLEAASHLEIIGTPPDQLSILFAKTAQAWRITVDNETLDALDHWWRQFRDLQTPPPVTLKALDRMLSATSPSQPGTRL